jgi:chromate transporter
VSEATDGTGTGAPVVKVGLAAIFLAFLRLGSTAFGGGTAGWLYRDIVQRRHWLDDKAFLAELALAQTLPGSQGVKLSLLIGRRLGGAAGAAIAPTAMLAVPFVVIAAIVTVYGGFAHYRIVHAVLDGVAAAVIGLTFATGIGSLAKGSPDAGSIALAAATVLCVGILGWPILPVVLGLAPISIGLALARSRR